MGIQNEGKKEEQSFHIHTHTHLHINVIIDVVGGIVVLYMGSVDDVVDVADLAQDSDEGIVSLSARDKMLFGDVIIGLALFEELVDGFVEHSFFEGFKIEDEIFVVVFDAEFVQQSHEQLHRHWRFENLRHIVCFLCESLPKTPSLYGLF